MKKYTSLFLTNLINCTCAVVIVGFFGLILEAFGKDFNLENITFLGSAIWILSVIFALNSYISLVIVYFKKKNFKRKVKKVNNDEQN